MKNIGARALKSIPLVLLALITASGASFAGGDLFDDDYFDCPARTRLQSGQIADLTVSRDSDDADEVNVSWTSTDPGSWGLGSNAFNTFLVLILDDDDGDPMSQSLSLGLNKTTFDGVKTGVEIRVEMAIVVGTAGGDYLISDILRQDTSQSLGTPSFSGKWHQLLQTTPGTGFPTPDADPDTLGHQYTFEEVGGGSMYYIGYGQNFTNYKKGTADTNQSPETTRLRIGLAHAAGIDDDALDNVDFDSYVIRIVDSDGDVVTEGDDVSTLETDYGLGRDTLEPDECCNTLNKLWIHDLPETQYPTFSDSGTVIINQTGALAYASNFVFNPSTHLDTGITLSNVRIRDGGHTTQPMHQLPANILPRMTAREVTPDAISRMKVSTSGNGIGTRYRDGGQVFANPPDEHRDFPVDTLASDETYNISAWAINDDGEVVSPVAKLKVYPTDSTLTLGTGTAALIDYLNPSPGVTSGTILITTFTVLK